MLLLYDMYFYHNLVQKVMLPRKISVVSYPGCFVKKKDHLKLHGMHLMHNPLSS